MRAGWAWKLQALNHEYDPARPLSGPPRWLIYIPSPMIRKASLATKLAADKRAQDGLDWEPTPL